MPNAIRSKLPLLGGLAVVGLGACAIGLSTGASHAQAPVYVKASKSNILFIQADDMRQSDIARMPNTRRLIGAAGTTFSRSYVSFPICCPSRATLNTGQYSHNNGVQGNQPPSGGIENLKDRGNLLAPWLQQAGYATSHVGKYLNGYGSREPATPQPGWTEWRGSVDQSTYSMWGYTLLEDGQPVTYGSAAVEDPALYQTDVYRDKGESFIRRTATTGQPFYLDLAFLAPHSENGQARGGGPTVRSAPRHRGRMAAEKLPRPSAFDEKDISDKPAWLRKASRLSAQQVTSITNEYRSRQESLLALDEAVARLVAVLAETGQLDNTFVIFTSDNGYFHGEHRVASGKTLAYEPSARVPLLIRGPGIPAGGTSRELGANVDLAATFSEIAGARPGRALDGRSFLRYARDPSRGSTRPLLLESGPGQASSDLNRDGAANRPMRQGAMVRAPTYKGIRAGDYKYVEYADGSRELYDLARDPQELRNRVTDRRYASLATTLSRRLDTLRRCRGAACSRSIGKLPGQSGST